MLATFFDNLIRNLSEGEATAWTVFGLMANVCFSSRFLVQWLVSEKRRESVVPTAFWWLSLLGGVMMTVYTIHVARVPLIIGALPTPFIAARNLWLIRRQKREQAEAPPMKA